MVFEGSQVGGTTEVINKKISVDEGVKNEMDRKIFTSIKRKFFTPNCPLSSPRKTTQENQGLAGNASPGSGSCNIIIAVCFFGIE